MQNLAKSFLILSFMISGSAYALDCKKALSALKNEDKRSLDERYHDFKRIGGSFDPAESVERNIFVRDLLTQAFTPFFKKAHKIKDVDLADLVSWRAEHENLFKNIIYGKANEGDLNKGYLPHLPYEFNQRYEYFFNTDTFWSPLSDEKVFRFGVKEESIPYFRSLIASVYYITSKLDYSWFGDLAYKGRRVLNAHSYTKTQLTYAVDFAFLSFLQAITLLDHRPKFLRGLSDEEWLELILIPQEGEKLSLVEKLSIVLKPAILGQMSMDLKYVDEPLVLNDKGILVFSDNMKLFFRTVVNDWSNKAHSHDYELGTGCPAGFCGREGEGSLEEKSSVRLMSEVLLSVFSAMKKTGPLPEDGSYKFDLEPAYLKGDQQRKSLKYSELVITNFESLKISTP